MADYDFLARLQQLSPNLSSIFQPQMNEMPSNQYDAPDMQGGDFMGPQMPTNQMPLQGLFSPSYEHMNALANQINAMPQREEPSLARNIGARLSGLAAFSPATYHGGAALGLKVNPLEQQKLIDQGLNAPYYEKLQDWQTKLKPMEDIAKLEGTSNVNQRITSDEILRRNLEAGRLTETGKKNEETVRANQAKEAEAQRKNKATEEIRAQRVAVQDFVAKNKGRKVLTDSEGNVYTINPETNEAEYALSPAGEKISSATLTDAQKEDIQHKNKLAEIAARTSGAVTLEGAKQGNREKNIEAVFEGKKGVKEAIPGFNPESKKAATTKEPSESQKNQALKNRANILANQRPDLAPYIKVENGMVKIAEPSTFSFSNTGRQKAEEARSILFGTQIKVKKGNDVGYVPADKLEQAVKDGYQVIQQ